MRCRRAALRAPEARYAAHGGWCPGPTLRVLAGPGRPAMREIPERALSNPPGAARDLEAERDPDQHVVRVDVGAQIGDPTGVVRERELRAEVRVPVFAEHRDELGEVPRDPGADLHPRATCRCRTDSTVRSCGCL